MVEQRLTRDEWRALGVASLTAAAVAAATGLVTWGFEEAKRALAERRKPPETPKAEG